MGSVSSTDRPRTDERKWTRAFNRLEKAVSRHIDAKEGTGFTDDADDALHSAHKRIMRDVGPCSSPSSESRLLEALGSEEAAGVMARTMAEVASAPRCSDWGDGLTSARLMALAHAALPALRSHLEALAEGETDG